MAPKKTTQGEASSSTQPRRATKHEKHKTPPLSYSNSQIRQRTIAFSQRIYIPSRFMSSDTLRELGVLDEVHDMLERVGLLQMAFDTLPTFPSLVSEFLASFCLRTHHIDEQNPWYSMRFKLRGRERFLTTQIFDSLFGFTNGGQHYILSNWRTNTFWASHCKQNSSKFLAGHTKSSSLQSKALWYIQRFLAYSINARGLSHESISFDDLYLLHCIVDDINLDMGRIFQWKLWLISDSISGNICIGAYVTKIAHHFGINTSSLDSIPSLLLDNSFIKNCRKFTRMNEMWY